jgi:hypothetical protein
MCNEGILYNIDQAENEIKEWVAVLRSVHADIVGDVDFIEAKWIKFRNFLETKDFKWANADEEA